MLKKEKKIAILISLISCRCHSAYLPTLRRDIRETWKIRTKSGACSVHHKIFPCPAHLYRTHPQPTPFFISNSTYDPLQQTPKTDTDHTPDLLNKYMDPSSALCTFYGHQTRIPQYTDSRLDLFCKQTSGQTHAVYRPQIKPTLFTDTWQDPTSYTVNRQCWKIQYAWNTRRKLHYRNLFSMLLRQSISGHSPFSFSVTMSVLCSFH